MFARRASVIASSIFLLLALASAPSWCAIKYVKTDGNDSNDGSSWDLAKKTVQAGLYASVSGDEVWVAQGTYVERIWLTSGVKLYGGYSGSGTTRDIKAYVTILDGNQGGSVVTSWSGIDASTVIDGFTIRNGIGTVVSGHRYGGGIYCYWSSPTISNNIITANGAARGGGIGCYDDSEPTIANNTITGNSASQYGGGICCYSSSPTIWNNVVTANCAPQGGAIYCLDSVARITNNTITGNSAFDGGGILCYYAQPTILNNIVAFNSSGICKYDFYPGAPSLHNNNVYGNTGYDYSNLSAGTGDISADPLFASKEHGDLHIQPGSPCINAGCDECPGVPPDDMDGQPRDSAADIGADESYGEVWPPGPYAIVRVTPTGEDANDGSAWDDGHAKRTVQAGTDAASALGGEVWVKAGTYAERITLREFAYLYGGFAGAEAARSQRNWVANVTILDGGAGGSVVTARAGQRASAIDGFTIRNGNATSGGGIHCYYSSPTISNNAITGNTASYVGGGIYCDSHSSPTISNNAITGNGISGIYCSYYSSPTISNNTITGNTASSFGGGIHCYSSSPTITNNTITGNTASSFGGGIHCDYYSSPTITNNTIRSNGAYECGGGISCVSSSSPTITNNTITENTASSSGGGIYYSNSGPAISNNTLTANSAGAGGGMYCSGWATITNTILAFNSSGVCSDGTSAPALQNNDVYGNTDYNYSGLSPGAGDMSLDPLFANRAGGDYHLTLLSPCIGSGGNGHVTGGSVDMDGEPRILPAGGTVDIGADEYSAHPVWLAGEAKRLVADGQEAYLTCRGGVIVTACFGGIPAFYVESPDRASGLQCRSETPLNVGQCGIIHGMMATIDGERVLAGASVVPESLTTADVPAPVGLVHRDLGGSELGLQQGVLGGTSLNNIGLLVTVFGNVTFAGADCFYLDDGSKLNDDSGHIGVKVSAQGISFPSSGFVKVTGISSCEKKGTDLVRLIRAIEILPVP